MWQAMLPLIFCSRCAQKFWGVHTFLEMTNICATTYVQQYVCGLCAVNLCMCTVSKSCVRAHGLQGNTGGERKQCKINRVRYLFLFSGIGYTFFYKIMKLCLHLSVQLTDQDCFKCFGEGFKAHPVFACSNLEF